MIKILLTCSAGMSTLRLEANMKEYIKELNLDYEVIMFSNLCNLQK